VGVDDGVLVGVAARVCVGVRVGVGCGVCLALGDGVGVVLTVGVAVELGTGVAVCVGKTLAVGEGKGRVGVVLGGAIVGTEVNEGVRVGVAVAASVAVVVGVVEGVLVGVWVGVAEAGTGHWQVEICRAHCCRVPVSPGVSSMTSSLHTLFGSSPWSAARASSGTSGDSGVPLTNVASLTGPGGFVPPARSSQRVPAKMSSLPAPLKALSVISVPAAESTET
jgi:hypothetical protein